MKVGDIVRYLNAVGGGKVTKIDDKIAYVEEPDGFETPVLIRECVVVDPDGGIVPKKKFGSSPGFVIAHQKTNTKRRSAHCQRAMRMRLALARASNLSCAARSVSLCAAFSLRASVMIKFPLADFAAVFLFYERISFSAPQAASAVR